MKDPSSSLRRLVLVNLGCYLLVLLVGALALILPPRPLQLWLPSVLSLLSVLITGASLASLNQGLNEGNRRPISLYLAGISVVLLLHLGAALILLWGLTSNKEMSYAISIPLLLLVLVAIFVSIISLMLAAKYRSVLPATYSTVITRPIVPNGKVAYSNSIVKDYSSSSVSIVPKSKSQEHELQVQSNISTSRQTVMTDDMTTDL